MNFNAKDLERLMDRSAMLLEKEFLDKETLTIHDHSNFCLRLRRAFEATSFFNVCDVLRSAIPNTAIYLKRMSYQVDEVVIQDAFEAVAFDLTQISEGEKARVKYLADCVNHAWAQKQAESGDALVFFVCACLAVANENGINIDTIIKG